MRYLTLIIITLATAFLLNEAGASDELIGVVVTLGILFLLISIFCNVDKKHKEKNEDEIHKKR